MTKSKTYRYGKTVCKSYSKAVGHGWEVGFYFDGKPLFVGNFIHAKEANDWFRLMNRELIKFSRKYTTGYKFPVTWFSNFLKNHLYTQYYGWLDKVFVGYNRNFKKAWAKNYRTFQATKGRYHNGTKKTPFLKAA